jgi:hypothetical protein
MSLALPNHKQPARQLPVLCTGARISGRSLPSNGSLIELKKFASSGDRVGAALAA